MLFLSSTIAYIFLGIIFGAVILSVPTKLAIAFVLGCLIFVIILIRTDIGLLLTIAAFPFEIAGNFNLAGPDTAFQTISVVKILGIFTAISWLIQFVRKKDRILITPQLIVITGLILTGIISIYLGTYHGEFYTKKAMKYLSMYIIYLAIFFMMTNILKTKALLKKIIVVLICIAVIASLYSFVQRFVPGYQFVITSKDDDYYRSHGAIVDPTELSTLGFNVIRTSSIMAHPDAFALFLGLTIAFSFYLLEMSKSWVCKYGIAFTLALQFSGLILTFCRGGTYTVILILTLMIIKRVIKPSWEKIFILLSGVVLLIVIMSGSTTAISRLFAPGHVAEAYSFHGRIDLMLAGIRMFIHNNWIVGIGMGNYDYNLPLYSKIPFTYEPTNEYTRILSEMGILGVLLSLSLFFLTFRDFRSAGESFKKIGDLSMYHLTNTCMACFIGFLFYGFSQVTLTRKELPIIMTLAIVLKQLAGKSGIVVQGEDNGLSKHGSVLPQ